MKSHASPVSDQSSSAEGKQQGVAGYNLLQNREEIHHFPGHVQKAVKQAGMGAGS